MMCVSEGINDNTEEDVEQDNIDDQEECEYFQLVFKELFNADYGMFQHNPDNRTYWFNYQTFESNINFELIGTLLALAPWHQVILDIPILPMCYKHLLGIHPSMEDLEMW
jgi:hypothetical protein